jgi:hypothetical protein
MENDADLTVFGGGTVLFKGVVPAGYNVFDMFGFCYFKGDLFKILRRMVL